MINPHWLELPMSQINFHGPKDVRATEVLLYLKSSFICVVPYLFLCPFSESVVQFSTGHGQEVSLLLLYQGTDGLIFYTPFNIF